MLMKHTLLAIGALLIVSCPAFAQSKHSPGTSDDRAVLNIAARMYGFDPDLLMAIARVESNGNPAAVSPKGAQGLMQLMPATAERFGVSDPFDPVDNALGAARFLNHLRAWQLSHPEMNLPEMLAAYNAGENAVVRYGGVPPYAETQEYVRRVLLAYLLDDEQPSARNKFTSRPAPPAARPQMALGRIRAKPKIDQRSADTRTLEQLQDLKRRRELALERNR